MYEGINKANEEGEGGRNAFIKKVIFFFLNFIFE